jgi:hypothetical protein
MPDITTPIILDTMAKHLRRCAVLIDDPKALDIIMQAARALDDRADELRDPFSHQDTEGHPEEPCPKNP